MRGLFTIFSLGLDELGSKLHQRGFHVDVVPTSIGPLEAQQIREDYLRDPSLEPIVIIGHSMGGRECCYLSRMLQDYDIPVKLIVILDANSQSTVPANVARCVNLYTTNQRGIFHGSPIRGEACSTEVINIDVTKVAKPHWAAGTDHFNIHASEWIHGIVINEVLWACPPRRASASPASSSGGAVQVRLPIRCRPCPGFHSPKDPAVVGLASVDGHG